MDLGAATHTGYVRAVNEDGFFASCEDAVFAVADGMGGHEHGEVASRLALEVIARHARSIAHAQPTDLPTHLHATIQEANTAILAQAEDDDAQRRMGTTVVLASICQDRLYFAHIGDSRLYLLRGDAFTQLTRDHSLVQSMVDSGEISPDEAAIHPLRHQITRVVGGDNQVSPEIASQMLEPGDLLLLCTDGLTGAVDHDTIKAIVSGAGTAQQKADALIAAALQAGGPDNITVLIAAYHTANARPAACGLACTRTARLPLWQTITITLLAITIALAGIGLWGYTHPHYRLTTSDDDTARAALLLQRYWPILPMLQPESVQIPAQPTLMLREARPFLTDHADVANDGIILHGEDAAAAFMRELTQKVIARLLENAKASVDEKDFNAARFALQRAQELRGDPEMIRQVQDLITHAETTDAPRPPTQP